MFVLLALFAQVVAPIESGTATSIMGWGGFVLGLGAFGILLWDRITGRGRSLAAIDGKIDRLSEQVGELGGTQKIMDGHLASLSTAVGQLTYEVKGVDGLNGLKGKVRDLGEDVQSIQVRNAKMDVLAGMYERERRGYEGPERRQPLRGSEG